MPDGQNRAGRTHAASEVRDITGADVDALALILADILRELRQLPERLAATIAVKPASNAGFDAAAAMTAIVRAVYDCRAESPWAAGEIISNADPRLYALISQLAGTGSDQARRFGLRCAAFAGRPLAGLVLTRVSSDRGGRLWAVETVADLR